MKSSSIYTCDVQSLVYNKGEWERGRGKGEGKSKTEKLTVTSKYVVQHYFVAIHIPTDVANLEP